MDRRRMKREKLRTEHREQTGDRLRKYFHANPRLARIEFKLKVNLFPVVRGRSLKISAIHV